MINAFIGCAVDDLLRRNSREISGRVLKEFDENITREERRMFCREFQ
jgi:hypothetical protein